MEQKYWINRKRASMLSATNAMSSEARLIHFNLAGRYSVKAAAAEALQLRTPERTLQAPSDGEKS